MENMSSNIKKVMMVFLLLFVGIVSYITYFELAIAPSIVKNPHNMRGWAKRNEVLRGTMYDRNMQPLTQSERVNTTTQKRIYTGGAVFAHVLGYVDIRYGITGLENLYDSELMADDTSLTDLLNFNAKADKVGHNVITTIDSNLQKKAYDLLGNNKGAVVVLNPKTGEILAMVSKPSYDPNDLKNIWGELNKDTNSPLINRAVSGLYPPGSTFKTITALAGLENISNIMNRTFIDKGKLVFNSKESLSNFDGEVFGSINFKEAYVHSSNVVFGTLGEELGNSKLRSEAEKFYFNKNIPADGVVIDNSRFPTYNKNEIGNIAQSAIGQSGVLATPMEMALIASTIGNNGVMMKPYLVKAVTNNAGSTLKSTTPSVNSTVISPENASIMKAFMKAVVTEGTGMGAAVTGVEVCGKTGTADNSDGAPHAWFIGFAPYQDPTIALAVIVENGGQGGKTAASIASQLIKTYYNK